MNAPVSGAAIPPQSRDARLLEIPLVSGTGRDEASRECLLQIITDLGNYYRRRNLSHREKFGSTDPEAEAVISELAIAYDRARQSFSAADENETSSLESSISLKLFTQ